MPSGVKVWASIVSLSEGTIRILGVDTLEVVYLVAIQGTTSKNTKTHCERAIVSLPRSRIS